jgi:hypothetical protein
MAQVDAGALLHSWPVRSESTLASTWKAVALMQMRHLDIDQSRLASEKADLENALEAEQEYIMHKLHRQVCARLHHPRRPMWLYRACAVQLSSNAGCHDLMLVAPHA